MASESGDVRALLLRQIPQRPDRLWIKNMFDVDYRVGGTELVNTGLGYTADFLGAPRTDGVELRCAF